MKDSTVMRKGWHIFLCICLLSIVMYLPTAGAVLNGTHFQSAVPTDVFCDYMGTFKIDGVDAQTGDEVAFFDPQGVSCGLYVVDDSGQYGVVHVYGDDSTTSEVDEGADPEDVLTIKIWDASEGIELTGVDLRMFGGSPPSGSSFVTSFLPPVWQDRAGFILNINTAAHFAEPVGTPYVCNYIGNFTILGVPADIGDEVAVFGPDGVLCGHVRVTTTGQYGIIQVYGDEEAVDGEELTFKVWDKSAGVEYEAANLLFIPGSPTGSFMASETSPVWTVDMGYVLDIDVSFASVNHAPHFITTSPEPDTCDSLAMPGHVYTFVIEAEDEETQGENLVYTLKGTPPAGMNIKSFIDDGYTKARIRWVPGDADAGRTIPVEIEVSDGEKTTTLSYDLRVLNPLVITPDSQTLLRINGVDVDKDFIISGGFLESETSFYSCELIDSDAGITTYDCYVNENGVFRYHFSTADRGIGVYRLKITDEKGFTAISGPIEIRDITAVLMTMDVAGPVDVTENDAMLTVADTATVYNGATVVVPAGSSTDPFTFTFKQVTNDQVKPNKSAVFGDVVEMNARKTNGNKVTFGTAIEVTLPYNNIPNIDRPQDLRVYAFNPDLRLWAPVPDYTVNTDNETISFRTTHFSLFTAGQPEELGTDVTGGILCEDYRMISFPCNPDDPDLAANLAEVLGNYDTRIWRCAAYNNSSMGYDEANISGFANMHPLEPGRAYWIISRYDKLLKVNGLTVDKEVPFETTLHPGWNMVANPYNEIINSDAITVSDDGVNFYSMATTGLTDNYIFKFDPHEAGQVNGYIKIPLNASMDPYQGYWIYNYESSDIIIRFEPASANGLTHNAPPLYKKIIWHARRSLHRFMDIVAATCYADGNSVHQPPPPPGFSGDNSPDSIGVAGAGAGCFIATAAYGSKIEPHVRILRDFRDRFLLDNTAGRRFVKFYYTYSPAVAGFIDGHANLQAFVRLSLLPVVGMSWIVLKLGPVTTLALMLLLIFLIRTRWEMGNRGWGAGEKVRR